MIAAKITQSTHLHSKLNTAPENQIASENMWTTPELALKGMNLAHRAIHVVTFGRLGWSAMGMPVLEPQKDLSRASVKTKDGERDVWINLKAQSSTTTVVSIRVGYFGDEAVSRRIHDAIQVKF